MTFFEFEQALIRLKDCVGVRTDKDVARLLGMDVSALNKRKHRGSFPVEKLRQLAESRPELQIDPSYVLTGATTPERVARMVIDADREIAEHIKEARLRGLLPSAVESSAAVHVRKVFSRRQVQHTSADVTLQELEPDELQLLEAYRSAGPAGRHATLAAAKAFADEAIKALQQTEGKP